MASTAAAAAAAAAAASSSSSSSPPPPPLRVYPGLVVFDLDMCVWSPEMYTLDAVPTPKDAHRGQLNGKGEGVVAVSSGYEDIRLFPAALKVLQDFYTGDVYPASMRIAAASSADTPRAVAIGRAAMGILEILPGVTMRQCFAKGWPAGFEGNLQIGRSPPLSSDKAATHFPILQRETGVPYNKVRVFPLCVCVWSLLRGFSSLCFSTPRPPFDRCCFSTTATGATTAPTLSAVAPGWSPCARPAACKNASGSTR